MKTGVPCNIKKALGRNRLSRDEARRMAANVAQAAGATGPDAFTFVARGKLRLGYRCCCPMQRAR